MSALTQLTHECPRSSVNFSQHVQPQSALGTSVAGLGCVLWHRNPGWSRWTDIHLATCSLQAVLLSSTLTRFFIIKYIFRLWPKMAGLFRFCLFFGGKTKFIFRVFYFMAEKVKSIFGQPLENVINRETLLGYTKQHVSEYITLHSVCRLPECMLFVCIWSQSKCELYRNCALQYEQFILQPSLGDRIMHCTLSVRQSSRNRKAVETSDSVET